MRKYIWSIFETRGRKLSHNKHVTTRVCLLIVHSPLEATSDRAFPKLNCHTSNGQFGDTADIWAGRYTVPYLAVSSTAVCGEPVASVCLFRLMSRAQGRIEAPAKQALVCGAEHVNGQHYSHLFFFFAKIRRQYAISLTTDLLSIISLNFKLSKKLCKVRKFWLKTNKKNGMFKNLFAWGDGKQRVCAMTQYLQLLHFAFRALWCIKYQQIYNSTTYAFLPLLTPTCFGTVAIFRELSPKFP